MLRSSQLVGLSLFKKVWNLDYHFYSVAAENLSASWALKSILQTTSASGHFHSSIQSLTQLFFASLTSHRKQTKRNITSFWASL